MRLFLLVLLLLIITGGWGSSPGFIDSIKAQIERPDISDSDKTHNLLQLCYYAVDNPVEGLRYGQLALDLAQKTGHKIHEAYAYGYIGMQESRLGNNLKATESYINSANIFRELGEVHQEGYALASIGSAFQQQGDNINALKYLKQGLQLFQAYGDTQQIANCYLNIGETFRRVNMPDSAIIYFNEGIAVVSSFETGDDYQSALTLHTLIGNMGIIHVLKGEYAYAEKELIKATHFFDSVNDPYRKSVYYAELGKLHFAMGNATLGEKKIEESYQIAESAALKEQIRDFSHDLSKIYESQQKYASALKYYKQYKMYDDSIKNVETVRQMEQQQSQFELSKKEEQISILNKVNKLQRNLAFVLLLAIVIFVVMVSVLFRAYRNIKASNLIISQQKQLVEKREIEKALLLKELNHRVKNNLQMVSSLLNLHARQLKDHPAAEALMAGRYRVEALTLIHQKLYRDDVDTKIDIQNYIEDLSKNLVLNFGPEFTLDLKLEPLILKIDKAIPLGLVMNELITNSLKYGGSDNPAPELKIRIENINEEEVLITVSDNGKGLPPDFNLMQSKSFGLKLVNSLVKQLSGEISYRTENGTCWTLKLFINKLK
ncbi:MAG TPA: histidine kinase dimerization/phosphoacceptor domain -containing protein [Prolixibacteraceae bacterium]|nr:histidine kinase dimerization/phosphoacceptor domain -containing protein [Prolixibacteraceae bacterium]